MSVYNFKNGWNLIIFDGINLGIARVLSSVKQSNQRLQAVLPNAGSGLSLTTPVIAGKKELFI